MKVCISCTKHNMTAMFELMKAVHGTDPSCIVSLKACATHSSHRSRLHGDKSHHSKAITGTGAPCCSPASLLPGQWVGRCPGTGRPCPISLGRRDVCVCVCVTGQEVRGLSHYSHFACVTAVVQANSTACSLMGFLSSLSAEAVDFDADEAFCF